MFSFLFRKPTNKMYYTDTNIQSYIRKIENFAFNGLKQITSLNISRQYLTYLFNESFNGLAGLKILVLLIKFFQAVRCVLSKKGLVVMLL